MEDFRKIENKLYYSKYCDKKGGNPEEIWSSIKNNKELLAWAIKPTKDKFGERDLVNGLASPEGVLYPDFEEGYKVSRVLDAIALSYHQKRWVNVEEIA